MRRLKRFSIPIGYALAVTELVLAVVILTQGSITFEYMHQHGIPRQMVGALLLVAGTLLIFEPRRDVVFIGASMVFIWVSLQTLFVALQTHTGFLASVFAGFSIAQMYFIFGEQRWRCDDE